MNEKKNERSPQASSESNHKSPHEQRQRPYRVAVVGGGCAGVTAAWKIASCSGFEVELYERSWRLGGKGASGRLADGRIREHGLHLWLGFYENAFALMRECYREVEAHDWGPSPHATAPLAHGHLNEAFLPEPHIAVGTPVGPSGFAVWSGYFAPTEGFPGEPLDPKSNPYTITSYLLRCVDLLKTLIQSTFETDARPLKDVTLHGDPSIEEALDRIAKIVRGTALTAASAMSLGLDQIEKWLDGAQGKLKHPAKILRLLKALASLVQKQLSDLAALDPLTRAKSEVIDIVLAIAVGLYRDRLLFRRNGFDAINDRDYRTWLIENGAREAAIHSRFLTGIYEFSFAFEGGDPNNPQLAAGVALRSALRMFFTYRGSMFWRLRSGMGDVVFAPLYRSLLAGRADGHNQSARSPVRVHFMHELSSVEIAPARDGQLYVSGLRFSTQGDPARISSTDAMALDVAGCWPDDNESLLQGSSALQGTVDLELGKSFDAVVFAMGIDDLRAVFLNGDLFSQLPGRWTTMAKSTKTVATSSAQLWFDTDFTGLGWGRGPGVVTASGMTGFETVADMTHTLASEREWRRKAGVSDPSQDRARSVAYMCSALPDAAAFDPLATIQSAIHTKVLGFLRGDARYLWPAAFDGRRTALDRLVVAPVVKVNAKASDRYTLSLPRTISTRLSPLDPSVANMTIAGDWTACGLDAGCVEAAVISGILACHALTGAPPLASIVGYNHP